MSEAETLRAAITVALAYLDAGYPGEAAKALREAKATPPEPTGLEERGA